MTGEPLYRQVKRHILERIAGGALAEGAQVPSENELTRTLGVSRMTAHRALRELTSEGRPAARPGRRQFCCRGQAGIRLVRRAQYR